MKEYLSPGVYPQENDKSFLESAPTGGSSATFIGAFTKGRAFIPTLIKDTNDLINKNGQPNGKFYSQYAALEYSKYKGDFWTQRLLWQQGWTTDAYLLFASTGSGATVGDVLGVLMPTGTITTGSITNSTKSGIAWSNLNWSAVKDGNTSSYNLSINQMINIDATITNNPQTSAPLYLFARTNDFTSSTQLNTYTTVSIKKISNFITSSVGYSSAKTPMVRNQYGEDLFYFQHLGDGNYTNKDIKVSIQNVNTSSKLEYTRFNVMVRAYNDTDKKPTILQAFYDLDLNPTSDNYIAKRIGDAYSQFDVASSKIKLNGDFANVSKYIRVVASDLVKSGTIAKLGDVYSTAKIPFISAAPGVINEYPTVYTSSEQVVAPNTHQGYNTNLFEIQYLSNPTFTTASITESITMTGNYTIPFYGGFDGINPSNGTKTDQNTLFGFDVTNTSSLGYLAYKKALDMVKHVDEFDIDLISIAGINLQDTSKRDIYEYAIQIAQNRGDCVVVADAGRQTQSNVNSVVNVTQDFDTSFGGVYFPSVKKRCPFTKTFPTLPVSTLIPAVIAYTELVSQPHYAPAGINRGALDVLQATVKLSKSDRDLLYSSRINPIASFASNGTIVWGQKTLQKSSSALDRLNVRILLNRIKKWVQVYGKTVLFDNNTSSLRQLFTMGVQKYLQNIVATNGLYAFKFKMDQTNNTPDVIDRNQLVGQIWIKPSKTAEYIILPINVLKSDAEL